MAAVWMHSPVQDTGWTFYTPYSRDPLVPLWLTMLAGYAAFGAWASGLTLTLLHVRLYRRDPFKGRSAKLMVGVSALLLAYAVMFVGTLTPVVRVLR